MALSSKVKRNAAIGALAVTVIGGAEGLRQTAYPDPASRGEPWTICYGHTGGVRRGEYRSMADCKALLLSDLEKSGQMIEHCIQAPMSVERYVAVLSLAHNIGPAGVCKSSIVRDLNAGRNRQACDGFLKYHYAAGISMPGLVRRRQQERTLCLASELPAEE